MIDGLVVFSVPCRGSGWHPTISTPPCSSQHEVSAVGLWLLPGLLGGRGSGRLWWPPLRPAHSTDVLPLRGAAHCEALHAAAPSIPLLLREGGPAECAPTWQVQKLRLRVGLWARVTHKAQMQGSRLPTPHTGYDPEQKTRPRGAKGLWQDWPPTGLTWVGVRALCQEGPPTSPLLPEPAAPACAAWLLPVAKPRCHLPPHSPGENLSPRLGWWLWAHASHTRTCLPQAAREPRPHVGVWLLGPAFPLRLWPRLCGQVQSLPSGLRLLPYSRVLGPPLRPLGPGPRPSLPLAQAPPSCRSCPIAGPQSPKNSYPQVQPGRCFSFSNQKRNSLKGRK